MKVSLVLATVGRVAELREFLISLSIQTYTNYELIVVDQNQDDRLVALLKNFGEKLPIKHIRSQRGLSRARNAGLMQVSGQIVGFPDDDCWYPRDLLETVVSDFLSDKMLDGLTGVCLDENNNDVATRFDKEPGFINKYNVWRRSTSVTLFFLYKIISPSGFFDESLGVGSGTISQSGEEIDCLLRLLASGARLYFDPKIIVRHRQLTLKYDRAGLEKTKRYAIGFGRVLRKNHFPIWFVLYYLTRPLLGIFKSFVLLKFVMAKCYWAILSGRYYGWKNKIS